MLTSFVALVHSQSFFSSHDWQPFVPRSFPESLHCSNFIWYLFCGDTLSAHLQFHTNPLSPNPYNLLLLACHIQAFFFTWQTAILSPNSDQIWPSWGLQGYFVPLLHSVSLFQRQQSIYFFHVSAPANSEDKVKIIYISRAWISGQAMTVFVPGWKRNNVQNRQMSKPAARGMDEWKVIRMRFPGLATHLRHLSDISSLTLLAASGSHGPCLFYWQLWPQWPVWLGSQRVQNKYPLCKTGLPDCGVSEWGTGTQIKARWPQAFWHLERLGDFSWGKMALLG